MNVLYFRFCIICQELGSVLHTKAESKNLPSLWESIWLFRNFSSLSFIVMIVNNHNDNDK